ncbi:CD1247 N-terminal domain-containing protein [Sedimentibacter sp.]|uniref:CD1247 N-terminal domain-containing protein n=1 Tax=Sedimentibacter sp. TaxID=1960295 RepID=UPI0028A66FA4|nr:CD1247 N-terminal domain-containing protein [Sedimentibacter sp.]
MDFLYEKISYLRGLADGLDVKPDSKEGKLFNALMEVIEEIADGMNDIVEEQDEVNEYLDLLDEDLSTVEEEIFGDLEIDEDDDYDFDFDDEYDDDYDDEFEEHECNCAEHEDL